MWLFLHCFALFYFFYFISCLFSIWTSWYYSNLRYAFLHDCLLLLPTKKNNRKENRQINILARVLSQCRIFNVKCTQRFFPSTIEGTNNKLGMIRCNDGSNGKQHSKNYRRKWRRRRRKRTKNYDDIFFMHWQLAYQYLLYLPSKNLASPTISFYFIFPFFRFFFRVLFHSLSLVVYAHAHFAQCFFRTQ